VIAAANKMTKVLEKNHVGYGSEMLYCKKIGKLNAQTI